MTVITIQSDSEETTAIFMKIAEERGVPAKTDEHRILTTEDVALGIGRKATQAEMLEYLLKNQDSEYIDIDTVFERFKD